MTGAVRYRVAEELETLSAKDGDLHVGSPRSTWRMYGDRPERLRVWESLIETVLGDQEDVASDGSLIVVTAGPPGAGKSTALDHLGASYGRCRRIDPDRVKELLVQRAVEDRIYEHLLQRSLGDGLPIMPMELSGLVHEESVRIADEIKRRCLRVGENLLVEGTLTWDGMIDVYLRDLARNGYENLSVVSVEVPIEVAIQRAADRWWLARSDPSNLNGGRFVPRATIANCYADDGRTIGSVNAMELARRANRAGFSVSMNSLSGAGSQTATRPATPSEKHVSGPG